MKIYTALSTAHAIRVTAALVADLPRDIDKKIYVFCESKATLSFEREIASLTGGTFNVEVMSFSRYVSKNVKVENFLSKAQAALLVRKLMKEHEEELVRLKPEAFSVPNDVYGLISQLKAALVKPSDLAEIIQSESGALRTKLKDVATVYGLYEDYVKQNGLTDESSYLSLMEEAVKRDEKLKGANVIVAAVQSYTKQTLEILKALNRVSSLDFVCVSGNFCAYTNESVNKISGLFPGAEVIPLREEGKEEQYAIAKGLFDPVVFTGVGRYSEKIKVGEATSIKAECDNVAAVIRYEVVENGRRYKDFSVICQNVSEIAPYLKESFYLYDIPVYVDENKNLDKHPVIGLIGGLIDVRRFNLLPEKAITLAKNGLFCSFEESRDFTKYVYENAISRKQMKQPFDDLISESVRFRIEFVTSKFALKDSVSSYIEAVKSSLDYLDVYNRGKNMSESLKELGEGVTAEFNDSALGALPAFFDEVRKVLGDVKVTLNEFKNVLLSAASSVKVATVPEYNDTVYLGDFKGGRLKESKILFCPELSSSVPGYKADVALLNDRELTKMDGYKLIIEPKLQIVNERERENIAVSLMSFTDKLYLSYSTTDKNGKPLLRSEIIDRILAIFSDGDTEMKPYLIGPNTFIPKDIPAKYLSKKAGMLHGAQVAELFREKLTNEVTDLSSFREVLGESGKDYLDLIDYKEGQIFDSDLGYNGKFSATTIETFFSCPYKAFAQNVLKLKESATGDTKVYEIGNVLHNVMEKFINNFSTVNDEKGAKVLTDRLFDEEIKMPLYARYLNKSQYKSIFVLLKEEAIKECTRIYNDVNNSAFKPIGAEIEFNESGKNGLYPLYLKTPLGNVALRGKIDRADEYFDGKDHYFRIIDYKSGQASNEDSDFYAGKKVQLYLYMNVFAKKGYVPAGAHYFKLTDDYGETDALGGEYLGKSLLDVEILDKLDKNFIDNGESKNLGVKLKNGEVSANKNLLSAGEFDKYMKYAIRVCESGAQEMQKGCFIPSPAEGSCDFCKFKGLCGYDTESGDNNRDISRGKKQSILNSEDDDA